MQVTRILELSKVRLLLMSTEVFHGTVFGMQSQGETGNQDGHAVGILLLCNRGLCPHSISSSFPFVFSTSLSHWEPSNNPEKD